MSGPPGPDPGSTSTGSVKLTRGLVVAPASTLAATGHLRPEVQRPAYQWMATNAFESKFTLQSAFGDIEIPEPRGRRAPRSERTLAGRSTPLPDRRFGLRRLANRARDLPAQRSEQTALGRHQRRLVPARRLAQRRLAGDGRPP